jgi:F0F1-type ATP synthase assembly protein I
VIAINLPPARRLALGVALGQAAVTLAGVLASWLIAGSHAALSALLGGGIATLASLVMALLAFGGRASADPLRALRAFFIGEFAKVVMVIVLFAVVLKTMTVVPLAMLGTYIATFFAFFVALGSVEHLPGSAAREAAMSGRDS